MSSLRLALKQSLQETGHLLKDKKKKSGNHKSAAGRRRQRIPGDPPRKRGRPRKHPVPDDSEHSDHNVHQDASGSAYPYDDREHDMDHSDEGESDSENEFSYDSEEEEEHDDSDDENEDSERHDEDSGHLDEEEDVSGEMTASDPRGPSDEHDREGDHPSSGKGESQLSTESDDERAHRKKLFKKHLQQAANKIQEQWKKKKGLNSTSSDGTSARAEAEEKGTIKPRASTPPPITETTVSNVTTDSGSAEKAKKRKDGSSSSYARSQTVPAPEPDVLEWSRSLSEKKCRKHITAGLRVKVRFAAKVKRDGKVTKKKMWYGGRVSAVSKEGSKIRIKYDDGTSEISKFPDKDVLVDDTFNGRHLVPADKFIPPPSFSQIDQEDDDDVSSGMPEPATEQQSTETQESKDKSPSTLVVPPPEEPTKSLEGANGSQSSGQDAKAEITGESDAIPENTTVTSLVVEEKTPESVSTKDEPVSLKSSSMPSQTSESPTDTDHNRTEISETPRPPSPVPETKMKEESTVSTEAPAKVTPISEASIEPASHQNKLDNHMEIAVSNELNSPTDQSQAKADKVAESPKQPSTPEATPVQSTESDGADVGLMKSPISEIIDAGDIGGKSGASSPTLPKPSLTIRISNIKQPDSEQPEEAPEKPATPKQAETDSDEELFADTPVTERKVKSIQLRKKNKRKREGTEPASTGDQPTKKRMHLKHHREPKDVHVEVPSLTIPQPEDAREAGRAADIQDAVEALKSFSKEPVVDDSKLQGDSLEIDSSAHEKEEKRPPIIPKLKKKRERVASPVSSGRKSPGPRSKSPTPGRNIVENGDIVSAPETEKDGGPKSTPVAEQDPSSPRQSPVVRTSKGLEVPNSLVMATDDADDKAGGTHLSRSKASTDSLPSVRSGRRAAQQAKEKMNPKSDEKMLESVKKKKKRRREDGEEDAEQSDVSVDDRQWVQCDSCGKWRILPSDIKISSLPNHWYCHLNTYDPKRNSCSAPEQTAKQAAKEWRRARKRAKQQRLAELQAVELEKSTEETVKKEPKKEQTPTNSPRPPKTLKREKEPKRASPVSVEDSQSAVSGPDVVKSEKKSKKSAPQQEPAEIPTPALEPEGLKKPGRKRGRPARSNAAQKEDNDGDNVEWVQCEKCEKWRKLPPHISADELPDTWFCTMNSWNPDSASCEAPEDKADATHHEVGNYAGICGAGKYSYRSMLFGTGKKHNRPMSERSRAAESLFMRPSEDVENPYPTVMYSKSSCFVPRTSNFNKASVIEEEKPLGIFDVLSNSALWNELHNAGKPIKITSRVADSSYPKFLGFENLPNDVKETMREVVVRSLGDGTLTGDEVIREVQLYPWETLSAEFASMRKYFNADIIINSLLSLIRDGVVETTCLRNCNIPLSQWVPLYRKARSQRAIENEENIKASRCMKISKPWKQRETSSWVTGFTAFS